MNGDEKYGCKTMPILWGINSSKLFAGTWLIMLIAAILIIEVYILQFRWWWPALYCFFLILLPLLVIIRKLKNATTTQEFHHLSSLVKMVMLAGILSMLFFRLYL